MKKARKNLVNAGPVYAAAIGIGGAALLSTAFILFSPIFIINEYWEQGIENYIIPVFQLIVVCMGACVAGMITQKQKVLTVISVGLLYFLLMLSLGILVFDGIGGMLLATLFACVIGSGIAVLIVLKPKKSLVAKRRGGRYR